MRPKGGKDARYPFPMEERDINKYVPITYSNILIMSQKVVDIPYLKEKNSVELERNAYEHDSQRKTFRTKNANIKRSVTTYGKEECRD